MPSIWRRSSHCLCLRHRFDAAVPGAGHELTTARLRSICSTTEMVELFDLMNYMCTFTFRRICTITFWGVPGLFHLIFNPWSKWLTNGLGCVCFRWIHDKRSNNTLNIHWYILFESMIWGSRQPLKLSDSRPSLDQHGSSDARFKYHLSNVGKQNGPIIGYPRMLFIDVWGSVCGLQRCIGPILTIGPIVQACQLVKFWYHVL